MSDTYTKGIYIKGEEGLSSLVRTSKEDISDALGYTPATEQSVTDVNSNLTEHINNNDASKQHITEEEKNKLLHLSYDDLENAPAISDDDNSGTLYIADEEDNVIAKVDSEGVHSVGFHAGEEGITGDGETFIIVDKNDNKALEIEANGGVRVSELYLGQSGGPLSEILTNQTESNKNLTDHINNEARHVSPEEEALWSDKSFASITDNPIEVTEDGEFVIVDDDDNKGLVLDGTGLTVDKEVYIQTKEGDTNKVAVAKTLEEIQVAIEEIPDWALQAEKPEYSYSEIQGEYKDILNAPDIEDDSSNELIIMDQNDVIGTRIGENGIETINDITITYLKGKGESQTTEVMSVRDKFVEIEEAAADFKTEVQTSIQQLTTDIGNLSNIMNFRGAFVSLNAIIDPKPGDVVIITNDYEDAIYGKVKANSEWVYDEVGAWVEIGTASATDAAVADLQERVEVIEEDLNTATTGLKDRMTAIEDEVDEFKEEVAAQFAELPEVPDWALQPTKPTYEYDELIVRPQIEDYIDDDEFIIADSEDRKGLQFTTEGLETVGNVIITYKDKEEKEHTLNVREKFAAIDTTTGSLEARISEVDNKFMPVNEALAALGDADTALGIRIDGVIERVEDLEAIEIIDNLEATEKGNVLDATMGKELADQIIAVDDRVTDLTAAHNESINDLQEQIDALPDWAKEETKPSYDFEEIENGEITTEENKTFIIVDGSVDGNKIAEISEDGLETTAITIYDDITIKHEGDSEEAPFKVRHAIENEIDRAKEAEAGLLAEIQAIDYNAGNGLIEEDNTFSIKIASGETYLEVDENGINTVGIDDAISVAKNAAIETAAGDAANKVAAAKTEVLATVEENYTTKTHFNNTIGTIPADATSSNIVGYINEVKDNLSEEIVSESKIWTIVDKDGNKIAEIDEDGLETTAVKIYDDITIKHNGDNEQAPFKVREAIEAEVARASGAESGITERINNLGAGIGLLRNEDTFLVKIPENEKYLEATNDGLKSKGIDDAISAAKEVIIGENTDTSSADTIEGAKKYAEEKATAAKTNALAVAAETYATKAYVGTIPTGAASTNIINYINEVKEQLSEEIISTADSWKIVDQEGNIVAEISENGLATIAGTFKYDNGLEGDAKIAGNIEIATESVGLDIQIGDGFKVKEEIIKEVDRAEQAESGITAEVNKLKGLQISIDDDDYIVIKDADGTELTKTDASKFMVDGMLTSVTYNEATNELTFTWNTDAGVTTTVIKLSDLFDHHIYEVTAFAELPAPAVHGDIGIVKTPIDDIGHYSYTAYICDNGIWKAMDGNYSADNVYFDSNLVMTANIGVQSLDGSSSKSLSTQGKSLKQVLGMILAKEEKPTITANPSVTTKIVNSTTADPENRDITVEGGTTINPRWNASFSAGTYEYGPATGITPTSWEAYGYLNGNKVDGHSATSVGTQNFGAITLAANDTYKVNAKATYGAGAIAYTNLGEEYKAGNALFDETSGATVVQIGGGSKNDDSPAITAWQQGYYIGTLESNSAVTSDILRNVGAGAGVLKNRCVKSGNYSDNTTIKFDGTSGNKPMLSGTMAKFVVAYPSSVDKNADGTFKSNKGLTKFFNNSSFEEYATNFTKSTLIVAGADNNLGSNHAVEYTICTWTPSAAFTGSIKFEIVLS